MSVADDAGEVLHGQSPTSVHASAVALVAREARLLDERRWDDWLALFDDAAMFWMPAWRSADETTDDPDRELSLIYYESKARLAERVWRLRSGQSPASVPLVRTLHTVSGTTIDGARDRWLSVRSGYTVHCYDPKRKAQHVYFGFYSHELVRTADAWSIARKKIILLNDHIPAVLDFYTV